MSITFRYINIHREDGTLRKAPCIPIFVRNKFGKMIEVPALLDSGADTAVIPNDLAMFLGLEEKPYDSETKGIGGNVKVKESKLFIKVKNQMENYSLSIPVLVIQDDSDIPFLLGRNGFFENFHITFKQNEEKVVLKKTWPKNMYA